MVQSKSLSPMHVISLNTAIRPRSFKQNNPQKEISFKWCSPKRREIFLFIITVASHIRFRCECLHRSYIRKAIHKEGLLVGLVATLFGKGQYMILYQHATYTYIYISKYKYTRSELPSLYWFSFLKIGKLESDWFL